MINLEEVDISGWGNNNLSKVDYMFDGCSKLKKINMSSFNFGTDINQVFGGLHYVEIIELENANTSNLTSMSSMFNNLANLKVLDLSSFNTSSVTDTHSMFKNCTNLKTIYVGNGEDKSADEALLSIYSADTDYGWDAYSAKLDTWWNYVNVEHGEYAVPPTIPSINNE